MKNIIQFVRSISPFTFLPILFVITLTYCAMTRPVQAEVVVLYFFAESIVFFSALIFLKWITKGKETNSGKEKYLVEVVSSYFGETVRWRAYFKNKSTAHFSAVYQAWFLDHFGDVTNDCGIKYYIKKIV